GVPGTVERYSYTGNETLVRTLMEFDTKEIKGKQVIRATMQLTLKEEALCDEFQGVAARRITSSWEADDTWWDNQPDTTNEGRALVDPCALPRSEGSVWSWDLTAMARLWAGDTPNHGVMLSLSQELPMDLYTSEGYSFWP